MTINEFRGLLYGLAKYLGDVQAIGKAIRTRSGKPLVRRLARREAGRQTGKALGTIDRMFK